VAAKAPRLWPLHPWLLRQLLHLLQQRLHLLGNKAVRLRKPALH
jgi:hypothetical protein